MATFLILVFVGYGYSTAVTPLQIGPMAMGACQQIAAAVAGKGGAADRAICMDQATGETFTIVRR